MDSLRSSVGGDDLRDAGLARKVAGD